GKVLNTTATNQDHGVFLQVVPLTTNVGGDFITVSQTHTAYFTQCRVRLFWCSSVDAGAHASFLRATLQCRNARFDDLALSWFTNQLVDSCHSLLLVLSYKFIYAEANHPSVTIKITVKQPPQSKGCESLKTSHPVVNRIQGRPGS